MIDFLVTERKAETQEKTYGRDCLVVDRINLDT